VSRGSRKSPERGWPPAIGLNRRSARAPGYGFPGRARHRDAAIGTPAAARYDGFGRARSRVVGRMAKLADARDLKSRGGKPPCGFDPRSGHSGVRRYLASSWDEQLAAASALSFGAGVGLYRSAPLDSRRRKLRKVCTLRLPRLRVRIAFTLIDLTDPRSTSWAAIHLYANSRIVKPTGGELFNVAIVR
jgi:hypothetical protein